MAESQDVWSKILQGETLDRESAPLINGRIDLRRISVSQPRVGPAADIPVRPVSGVRGAHWSGIDWAGPNQKQGFVSGADLLESYGPDGIELFRRLAKGEEPS